MPTEDQVGGEFRYYHPEGKPYGEHHAGEPLIAEMRELDMNDGTEVKLIALDYDNHHPIVQWVDGNGLGRITTVDPEFFDTHFQAV